MNFCRSRQFNDVLKEAVIGGLKPASKAFGIFVAVERRWRTFAHWDSPCITPGKLGNYDWTLLKRTRQYASIATFEKRLANKPWSERLHSLRAFSPPAR